MTGVQTCALPISVLAKLMLAERFKPDFFEEIAREVGMSGDGKSARLKAFENAVRTPDESAINQSVKAGSLLKENRAKADAATEIEDWMKIDWVLTWASINPTLEDEDLRPYVFVN